MAARIGAEGICACPSVLVDRWKIKNGCAVGFEGLGAVRYLSCAVWRGSRVRDGLDETH